MAKKKQNIPAYGTAEINGVTYFRTRITDADGKRVPIYASTCEELYKKEQDARQQVQDILFRKQNPTVEDYCERWLLMRSATVTQDTLRNYRREMYKYIVEPLGNLYLSDVTTDDIKLALVPVSKRALLIPSICLLKASFTRQSAARSSTTILLLRSAPRAVFRANHWTL